MQVESGKCQYCDYEGPINRTYFRYDINCECHSPQHFEIVWHCNNCEPVEPIQTKLTINTKYLRQLTDMKKAALYSLKKQN